MNAAELSTIYRKIAEGNGKEYESLFSIQGLFFAVTEFDPVTDEPLHSTVDDTLHGLAALNISNVEEYGWHNDRLQHIADFVSSSVRSLIEVLHEKNLREHRITRPEQVREVDSRCMMWLAKKPGFTIKQKIASEQRMMGVYHTTSLDTAENRLFKAFMAKLDDLLSEKANAARKCGKPLNDNAERFAATVHNWLKSEECGLIGRWNNTPPNNTLLNDKNYRKIWKANIWLQNLKEVVQHDLERIKELKDHASFWLAAAKLNISDNIRFRQKVLFPDYEKLSFSHEPELSGFVHSDEWKDFKVSSEKECLDMHEFTGDVPEKNNSPEKRTEPYSVAAVDLNSVLPSFASGDGTKVLNTGTFTKKLLHQSHRITRKDKADWYSCSSARSKLIDSMHDEIEIKTFSVHSIFNSALHAESDKGENKPLIEKACADFAKTIKYELHCQKCIYITSDDANDFSPSVKSFKYSMNSAFTETEIMPRSIAALFARLPEIHRKFSEGDEILVCAYYDDYEIETRIRIDFNKELEKTNPETKGMQFKRLGYKKTVKRLKDYVSGLPKKLDHIVSVHDSELLKNRFSADSYHFGPKNIKKQKPLPSVKVVSSDFDSSPGALEYNRLQSITPDIPLWLDCLPKLTMIDSTGKEFVLVDPGKVPPVRTLSGEITQIPISETFSFPAKKTFYEFPLIQGEKSDNIKTAGDGEYFAYIKDTSFPIERETTCKLHLTYTYGAPTPYNLEFRPVSADAEFRSVTVRWENETHRDYVHDMPIPNFVQEYTWDDMRRVQGTRKDRETGKFIPDNDIKKDITLDWLPKEYKYFLELVRYGKIWPGYNRYNPKSSLRFPALTAWNNGRSIYDEDCSPYFRMLTIEAVENVKTILDKKILNSDRERHLKFFLACMHKDMPEWFSDELLEVIDKVDQHWDYPNWIAYALGDCSTEWQKELLSKTLDMLDLGQSEYVIRILAKALWRVNDFVFNLTAGDAGKILNAISKKLPVLNIFRLNDDKTFSACLECIVALCRLRETKDKAVAEEKMLEILSPSRNSDIKQILENLEYRKRTPIQVSTFLSFNIDRQGTDDKSPDLLYAAHGYLSGKIDNYAIKVREANFGNSQDE